MEITKKYLNALLAETYRRGYEKGRSDAADDVSSGAALLTSSAHALKFLRRLALGSSTRDTN